MSYTFYIEADRPPFFSELLEAFPQLSFEGEKPERDRFKVDYYYHVYEDRVSVRSLEIGFSAPSEHLPNSHVSIRVMTASSKDDYELCLAISAYFATLYGSKIQGEDSDPMNLDRFKKQFGGNWTNHMVRSGPLALRTMLTRGDSEGPFTLSGTRRSFHFGKASLAKIDSEDENVFIENYFTLARRVQYIAPTAGQGSSSSFVDHPDDFFAASIMEITNKSGGSCRLSVWAPGVDYLFPDVKYLSVMSEEYIIVPIELLEEFTTVEMLDDRNRTAKRVEENKWDAVVARAKVVQIDPSNLS